MLRYGATADTDLSYNGSTEKQRRIALLKVGQMVYCLKPPLVLQYEHKRGEPKKREGGMKGILPQYDKCLLFPLT